MERTRIYPLALADNPPEMIFPNGIGQPADMLYPMDYSYFENLAEFVARVGMFKIGYSISPAMVMNMVGKDSKYPFVYRDANGDFLSGGASYSLHMPANVPAENFLSITLYDGENASGLKNGQPFPSIGSLSDLAYNKDGSVDLYFGPGLPEGAYRVVRGEVVTSFSGFKV